MSDPAFFRIRAELCRTAARLIDDASLSGELDGMARVYSARAERLERAGHERPSPSRQ